MLKSILHIHLILLLIAWNLYPIKKESNTGEEMNPNIIATLNGDSIEVMDHELFSKVNNIEEANQYLNVLNKKDSPGNKKMEASNL